jgi:hypothetical protein
MSMMLAGWFALYGKNHHMYGISNNSILQGVTNNGKAVDPELKARHQRMDKRIRELKSILQVEENPIRKATYERELKNLQSLFDPSMISEDHVTVAAIQKDVDNLGVLTADNVSQLKMMCRF